LKIIFLAFEDTVGSDRHNEVEIAGRTSIKARATLPGQADSRAGLHAGRDLDLQAPRATGRGGPGDGAGRALEGSLEGDLDRKVLVFALLGPRPEAGPRARRAPESAPDSAKDVLQDVREVGSRSEVEVDAVAGLPAKGVPAKSGARLLDPLPLR